MTDVLGYLMGYFAGKILDALLKIAGSLLRKADLFGLLSSAIIIGGVSFLGYGMWQTTIVGPSFLSQLNVLFGMVTSGMGIIFLRAH
jgi:hypothetical protein